MAIGIAYSGTTATGVTREVLLAIASYSNPEDRRCLRSVADIASRAGCSRRAVFTSIKWLSAHNELQVTPRYNKSGDRTSSEYIVAIPLPGGGMAALPSAQALALGGAQAAAPFLKNLIKEQVIEDMPITPHGVKSANQSISFADQKEKSADRPEKKELPAPELTADDLFKLWNATTGERCKRLTPCDTGDMVTPKFRAMVQKRLNEQPRKEWWLIRCQELVWNEFWANAATLPLMLGAKWDPFSSGQFKGNKPRVST